jgi:hypothetical protein
MHAQKIVSPALHTRGFSMNNLMVEFKLLVAINSLMSCSFSSLCRFAINLRCSTCFSSRRTWPKLFVTVSFFQSNCFRDVPQYICSKKLRADYTLVMPWQFSQSMGKGTRSGRTTRSEPQRDWNSFAPATTIPRNLEGSIFSPTEETILRRETVETEKFIQKGETEGAFASR